MNETVIWNGVYGSFKEAHGCSGVFEDDVWVSRTAEQLRLDIELLAKQKPPAGVYTNSYVLPAIAAMAAAIGETLRIVDFGGGMGSGFLNLRSALPRAQLEYHVVEFERVCAIARKLFAGQPAAPTFHKKIPVLPHPPHLVHAGSSLQYVEDWAGLVARLAALQAPYLLLSDIPAGDIDTFVSLQHYYGSHMPAWFWNAVEFVAAVEKNGYILRMSTPFTRRILGKYDGPPMENFPPERRLHHTLHMLFIKRE